MVTEDKWLLATFKPYHSTIQKCKLVGNADSWPQLPMKTLKTAHCNSTAWSRSSSGFYKIQYVIWWKVWNYTTMFAFHLHIRQYKMCENSSLVWWVTGL